MGTEALDFGSSFLIFLACPLPFFAMSVSLPILRIAEGLIIARLRPPQQIFGLFCTLRKWRINRVEILPF